MQKLILAGVQMDVAIGEVEKNLAKMEDYTRQTVAAGAWLTTFPECTTTGYCFDSLGQAMAVAEFCEGPSFQRVYSICEQLRTRVVYGFLELREGQVYNSISLVGPEGRIGTYRKVHLPMLGVDRFTTPGDAFQVFDLGDIRIGMCICYDSSFPEASRVLALDGADVIILPTNWPPTSGLTAEVIPPARALENHVYFMAINRVGQERGFDFIGKSSICDPLGNVIVNVKDQRETILYAEIDPALARRKHLVNIPGAHEVHRINDRQPGSYSRINTK